ncbi:MAG TPA: hypothetical protein VFU13_03190 [Steroidobacteraceae bacterium]|nr:hypothetical protein [Steroidobacteraceae bacterium]
MANDGRALCLVAAMLFATGARASHCDLTAGVEARRYSDLEPDAPARDYRTLASVQGELSCSRSHGSQSVSAKVFVRWAQHGSERTHGDIRELQWLWTHEPFQVRAGIDRVFWGVTEFAHIVDVINQADIVEDPFGETKIGQPMLTVTTSGAWGSLSIYGLPRFRVRGFPGLGEPMRPAPPTGIGAALFESRAGRSHFDRALRYSRSQGPLDIGLSYFEGTSRDPRFLIGVPASGIPESHPYYELMSQAGVDLQLTLDEWAFKFEGARRHAAKRTRDAYTVGIEYAMVGVLGTSADLSTVLEYVRDHRDPLPLPGFLDDDLEFGFRISGNDARSSELKLGVTSDRRRDSRAWSVEFGTRIAAHWRLYAQARVFDKVSPRDPLTLLKNDSYLSLALVRYFLSPSQ